MAKITPIYGKRKHIRNDCKRFSDGVDALVHGVRNFLYGVNGFISELKNFLDGANGFISGLKNFLDGVESFLYGANGFISELKKSFIDKNLLLIRVKRKFECVFKHLSKSSLNLLEVFLAMFSRGVGRKLDDFG